LIDAAWLRPPRNKLHGLVAIVRGVLGYIEAMFEVLVFVYEHYWRGDACPEPQQLGRKLSAHGFDADEIQDALAWLDGLQLAAQSIGPCDPHSAPRQADARGVQSPSSMRVYSVAEQDHLGAQCLGFVSFLESAAVLPAGMREIVIDRAMAAPGDPVSLDDLKIIILMVYWSFGQEPDALVLDELCDAAEGRLAH
jgi:Smg protein